MARLERVDDRYILKKLKSNKLLRSLQLNNYIKNAVTKVLQDLQKQTFLKANLASLIWYTSSYKPNY